MSEQHSKMFNAFEELDQSIHDGVARVTVAWGRLDFVLRAACKRVEGVGWGSSGGKEILELNTHQKVIKRLRDKTSSCWLPPEDQSCLCDILDRVGCGRHEGLYGRRNDVIHSLWWHTSDGKAIASRVGDPKSQPKPFTSMDLCQLASDIDEAARRLLELTYPLVCPERSTATVSVEVSAAPGFGK